jgi:hypothetical protein
MGGRRRAVSSGRRTRPHFARFDTKQTPAALPLSGGAKVCRDVPVLHCRTCKLLFEMGRGGEALGSIQSWHSRLLRPLPEKILLRAGRSRIRPPIVTGRLHRQTAPLHAGAGGQLACFQRRLSAPPAEGAAQGTPSAQGCALGRERYREKHSPASARAARAP